MEVWREGVLPCDLSLTPKNIDFSQLIIRCWLELDMSSLDATESKIDPSWWNGVSRRGSRKIETISRLTADVRQPWMNYVNNENEYLIIGVVVRSEYSNIWCLHLIIGNAQKFVLGDKNGF